MLHISRSLLIVCCLLSAVSCRGVHSVRPIPAEKDSVIDPRLIGMWMPTITDDDDKKPGFRMPYIKVIAKSRTSKTTMDHLSFFIPQRKSDIKSESDNKEDELHTFQELLYIHHGKINTLCMGIDSPEDSSNNSSGKKYSIDRYELKDENTLLIYALDFDHLEKAVETKQLNGSFKRDKNYPEPIPYRGEATKNNKSKPDTQKKIVIKKKVKEKEGSVVEVILDDDPKKIIAYLEEHPEAFEKNPSVYKRMNYDFVKEKNEEAEIPKTVTLKHPPVNKYSPPEKIKVIAPADWQEWFSTFFQGLAAGVVIAMMALFAMRKCNSRGTD